MGLLDRLFGRNRRDDGRGYTQDSYAHDGYAQEPSYDAPPRASRQQLPDEQAVARYRYLLRTAPPEQIEQAHAEAFAQLTPDQRQQVLTQLAAAVPKGERPRTDDPATLARVATRAEMRQPGTLERALGGYGGGYGQGGYGRGGYGGGYGGPGMGSMIGGSLLGTIGGLVIGTAVADALFDTGLGDGGLFGGGDEEAYAEGYQDGAEADGGDYGGNPDADFAGGADNGGGDYGDFGGGDFGGGDF
ncbi:MAG: hypothetical protein ABWY29_02535 [Blastococcus sp.]